MNEPIPPEGARGEPRIRTFYQLVPDYRYTISDAAVAVVDIFVISAGSSATINDNYRLCPPVRAMEFWYVNNDALGRLRRVEALFCVAAQLVDGGGYTLAPGVSGGPGFSPLFSCPADNGAPWAEPCRYPTGVSSFFRLDLGARPACGLELNVVSGGGSCALNGVQWYVHAESYSGGIGGAVFNDTTWRACPPPEIGWVAKKSL